MLDEILGQTYGVPFYSQAAAAGGGGSSLPPGVGGVPSWTLPDSGDIDTFVSSLNDNFGCAIDSQGNVHIADTDNHCIKKIDKTTKAVTVVAGQSGSDGYSGDGGAATSATLRNPFRITFDSEDNLWIADTFNHAIRKVNASDGEINTVAGGNGTGSTGDGSAATSAKLNYPAGITVGTDGFWIADSLNYKVRYVEFSSGNISTFAGDGVDSYDGDGSAATSAGIGNIQDVQFDGDDAVFIAGYNNDVIRKVVISTGIITTVAGTGTAGFNGDGTATAKQLNLVSGLCMLSATKLLVADSYNHRIRVLDLVANTLTTVAGDGNGDYTGDEGPATSAGLNRPFDVCADSDGNFYIADRLNNAGRVVAA